MLISRDLTSELVAWYPDGFVYTLDFAWKERGDILQISAWCKGVSAMWQSFEKAALLMQALGNAQDKRPGMLALPAAAAEPADAVQTSIFQTSAVLPSNATLANGTDSSSNTKRKAEDSDSRSTRSKR